MTEYGHDEYNLTLLNKVSKMDNIGGYSREGNKLNMGFLGGPMMYSV